MKFENQSIIFIISMVLGLECTSLNFDSLEMKHSQTNIKKILTNVFFRSNMFLNKLEKYFNQEPEKKNVRLTFEEEIKRAKELQSVALSNIATQKENRTNEKEESTFNLQDALREIINKREGDNDDRNN